jgi:hypothetical protein
MALETGALERRLAEVPSFASTIPMVGAAAPSHSAVCLADRAVERSRRLLRTDLRGLRRSLSSPRDASRTRLRREQRRYLAVRTQFSRLLSTIDVYADCLSQRAEHRIGVLLRGLDILAEDGVRADVPGYRPPPLVCYLDDTIPGGGGAIRRAFTTLPGGETNAVGLIKIPRERLLGIGLASLLHEVGHQGVASLKLLPPYRTAIAQEALRGTIPPEAASWWSMKLSEVLPDLWAVAKLGITATLGLFGVLARTPRLTYFDNPTDPHPGGWLRALTSIAWGEEIMPHPLWGSLRALWLTLYPREEAPLAARLQSNLLLPTIKPIVRLLARLQPSALSNSTLSMVLGADRVRPQRLLPMLAGLTAGGGRFGGPPCEGLATVGLARHLGLLAASQEHVVLQGLATAWARRGVCARLNCGLEGRENGKK